MLGDRREQLTQLRRHVRLVQRQAASVVLGRDRDVVLEAVGGLRRLAAVRALERAPGCARRRCARRPRASPYPVRRRGSPPSRRRFASRARASRRRQEDAACFARVLRHAWGLPPWWRHLSGFRSDVYWWEPDGRVARSSPGDGIYFMACVHPDGHHTVFWGGSEGRPRLWIADGSSAPEALTDNRRSARFPAYSADGRTLQPRPICGPGWSASHRALDARGARGSRARNGVVTFDVSHTLERTRCPSRPI